jgi:hypothetical protein
LFDCVPDFERISEAGLSEAFHNKSSHHCSGRCGVVKCFVLFGVCVLSEGVDAILFG